MPDCATPGAAHDGMPTADPSGACPGAIGGGTTAFATGAGPGASEAGAIDDDREGKLAMDGNVFFLRRVSSKFN